MVIFHYCYYYPQIPCLLVVFTRQLEILVTSLPAARNSAKKQKRACLQAKNLLNNLQGLPFWHRAPRVLWIVNKQACMCNEEL